MFRIFSSKDQQAAEAAKAAAASRQANAPTRPPNAVQPPGVPGGVIPTHHSSPATSSPSSRPDPNAVANARKNRQAALAAAAFGTPAPPLSTHPVQPPRTSGGAPFHAQQSSGSFSGPPGGFGGDPSGDAGGGGGGGDFDMFGGLDVKGSDGGGGGPTPGGFPTSSSFNSIPPAQSGSYGAEAPVEDSSLLNALNGADESAASGFSFLSEDGGAGAEAGTEDASGFSFMGGDDGGAGDASYGSDLGGGAATFGLPSPDDVGSGRQADVNEELRGQVPVRILDGVAQPRRQ